MNNFRSLSDPQIKAIKAAALDALTEVVPDNHYIEFVTGYHGMRIEIRRKRVPNPDRCAAMNTKAVRCLNKTVTAGLCEVHYNEYQRSRNEP